VVDALLLNDVGIYLRSEQFHGYENHFVHRCYVILFTGAMLCYVITLITNSYIDYYSMYDLWKKSIE
jgi:hypothetical protein